MIARVSIVVAAALAAALMVSSLWAWQQAPHLVFDADRPDLALWAVRTAAIAVAALAQAVLLFLVVGRIYQARGFDTVLRVCTAAVFTVAGIGAIVLSLANR